MAQRRTFSPAIVESDAFLDMPVSTQSLYFHLGMNADDDGFVNPKRIMRMIGVSDDDLKILIAKRFILPFENGVVVIKHWRINNLIRKDWYRPTQYIKEMESLFIKKNGAYSEHEDLVTDSVTTRQRSIVKYSIDKYSKVECSSETPQNFNKTVDNMWTDMINLHLNKYSPLMIKFFSNHWRQKCKDGKNELWQVQPAFDIELQLETWKLRDEKWEFERQNK